MGFLKQMKDMKTMVAAAPGMIEQGQQIAANAQAMQAAQMNQMQMGQMQQAMAYQQQVGQPIAAEHLAPIAGVDLPTYSWVAKQVANSGYNQSLAAGFAAQRGIAAADWDAAAAGWSARMTSVPAIGPEFRRHYDVA
ncbi:MAG: hypothetical protein Q7V62_13050 [Actinomycetota bacterium]|nr:hypothetical protein [Actinomycetota bacterium]